MLKRKLIYILLTMFLIVSALSSTAFAAEGSSSIYMKAFMSTTEGETEISSFSPLKSEDTFTVKVIINNITELKGIDTILEFDSNILEVQKNPEDDLYRVTKGIDFEAPVDTGTVNDTQGIISFSGANALGQDFASDKEILSIEFKVKQEAKGVGFIWFRKGDGITFINNQNVKYYPDSIAYLILPVDVTPLELAGYLVNRAENSHLQQDVNTAYAAVGSLNDEEYSVEKTAFNTRLEKVGQAVTAIKNAVNAIEILPESTDITLDYKNSVESARALVKIAEDSGAVDGDIRNLQKLVECEFEIQVLTAEKAVINAETSKLKTDLNAAKVLVDDLPEGNIKNGFTDRLNAVQKAIYILEAIDAINGLPQVSEIKLSDKVGVTNAKNLVETAKTAGATDSDITNLQKLVDCEKKIQLLEAGEAVKKAEDTKLQVDVDAAKILVDALQDGQEKDDLNIRLSNVQKGIYITAAMNAINVLPNAASITLDDKTKVVNARTAVNTAKGKGVQDSEITNLQKLLDCETKIRQIEALNSAINAINNLPQPTSLTLGHKAAVENAKALVKAAKDVGVSESQITNLSKLNECIDRISLLEAQPSTPNVPFIFVPPVVQTGATYEIDKNHVKFISTTVMGDNSVRSSLTVNDLNDILKKIPAEKDGSLKIIFDYEKLGDKRTYELQLTADALKKYPARTYEINTPIGIIEVKGDMFKEVEKADSIRLAIGPGNNTGLSIDIINTIKSRPFIELKAYVDDKPYEWRDEKEFIQVSIPYLPSTNEQKDIEHISALDIDSNGKATQIKEAKYDSSKGCITFFTNKFNKFAALFIKKSFNDLKSCEWAREAIEVLASKDIVFGKTNSVFDPISPITRGDFALYLVNTLGITAEVDSNFDDVKKGTPYYEAIGILKKLEISNGAGNNKFKPETQISRQDIMVLLARALKVTGKIKSEGKAAELGKYSDASKFSAYAVESAAILVKEGIFSGTGDRLNPKSSTTRAQAAVILYRIYNKY